MLARFLRASKYTSLPAAQFLFAAHWRLLGTGGEPAQSKGRAKQLELALRIMVRLLVELEAASSLPQSVAALALPARKKLEETVNRLMAPN